MGEQRVNLVNSSWIFLLAIMITTQTTCFAVERIEHDVHAQLCADHPEVKECK